MLTRAKTQVTVIQGFPNRQKVEIPYSWVSSSTKMGGNGNVNNTKGLSGEMERFLISCNSVILFRFPFPEITPLRGVDFEWKSTHVRGIGRGACAS
jgi:hypothetical protein